MVPVMTVRTLLPKNMLLINGPAHSNTRQLQAITERKQNSNPNPNQILSHIEIYYSALARFLALMTSVKSKTGKSGSGSSMMVIL